MTRSRSLSNGPLEGPFWRALSVENKNQRTKPGISAGLFPFTPLRRIQTSRGGTSMRASYRGPEITAAGHSLNEFTDNVHCMNKPADTGHCLNELTVSGHCLSDLTVSGTFITMAQKGTLSAVSWMIHERTRIAADLQQVEQKLLACNNPLALASLAGWCERRNRDFGTELKQRAAKLETKKCELKDELLQIDERLALENIGPEWTFAPDFASLIEISRPHDPTVAVRFMIINKNPGKSAFEICKVLDSHLRDGELPVGFFPESWTRDFGVKTFVDAHRHPECNNRVAKMITTLKQKIPRSGKISAA
jgi:hypothetical protein